MRIYEELFIIRPDAPEEEIDAYVEQIKELIVKSGGTVEKAAKWGVRKLAYRVNRQTEGFYILLSFTCGAQTVRELQRRPRRAAPSIARISCLPSSQQPRSWKRAKRFHTRCSRNSNLARAWAVQDPK